MQTKLSLALLAAFATAQQDLIIETKIRELTAEGSIVSFEPVFDDEKRLLQS